MSDLENNQDNQVSSHGGARPGAGRPPGKASTRSREVADRLSIDGITPLEVMVEAMRKCYVAGDLEKASEFAKDAAPYMHAKLQATAVSGDEDVPLKTSLTVEFVGKVPPET